MGDFLTLFRITCGLSDKIFPLNISSCPFFVVWKVYTFGVSWLLWSQRSPKPIWRHHPPEGIGTDFQRNRQGWELEAMASWEWNLRGLRAPRCCLCFPPRVRRSGCFTQGNDSIAAAGFCLFERQYLPATDKLWLSCVTSASGLITTG